MVKLKLITERASHVSIAMMALAAIMLADTMYQTGMHVVWRRWLPATLAEPAATTQPAATQPTSTQSAATQKADKKNKKKNKAKPRPIAEVITRRNIFAKPGPKGHGLKLTGVAFDTALFQTRSGQTVAIEEGQSGHGVKVVAIKDYEVTIEYKGKTETMKLFARSSAGCWSAGDAHAEGPSVRPPGDVRGPSAGGPPPDARGPANIENIKRTAIRERFGRRAVMMQGRRAVMIEGGASPQTQEAQ